MLAVMTSGLLVAYTGAWSGLVNPALPVDVRCAQVLDFIFLQHWFVTLPCIGIMTGGMYLLVAAVMKRHRSVFNFSAAVVLTWLLVGLIVGLFLMGYVVR